MSLHRIVALFRRVTLEIVRDRPSLALLFIAPLVMSGLITFIIREGDTPTVHAVLVNEAGLPGTMAAAQLRAALEEEGGSFGILADEAAARSAVERGDASIAVVLPAGLGTDAAQLTLITDGLDPLGEATQVGRLQRTIMASAAAASGGSLPTIRHLTVYGAPSDDPIGRFAPAIVGFFAYFFVYLLTGVSFLRERTGGTLERLMATPVARSEIVIGYSLGFGLMAALQMIVLLTWVLVSVRVPALGPLPEFAVGLGVASAGSAIYAFLVVLLLALGAVSLGILVSTFARTELQVIQSIPLILVPQFLLSGVLFPTSSLPEILQPLVVIMPVRYAVDGLRQVFVAGADLGSAALLANLLILGVFAAVFATLASLIIRREVA
ncbi:MAG TPA: ABC transporter permease [Candidatus Deferrimicrobium sp.]|nr:ABC transporter permease [Candidatus Deferrimicrobium sp.]